MGQDASRSKLVIPDSQKADTVRAIFQLMASGKYTIDTLREELFQSGMYFSQRTQRWTRSHLAKLLRHPFYKGKILWRGQIYEGKHEPLVDQDTWEKVQEILNGRNRVKEYSRRQFTYGHGLIKCAHCGYNITAEMHKQRYIYYICSQRRYREHPLNPVWVSEPDIEYQVITMLNELTLPKEVYNWAIEYLEHILAKDQADEKNDLQKLKRRLSGAQATMDALLLKAAHTDDSLSEGFMRLAKQKQGEITLLQQRIEQVETGKRENCQEPVKILELAQHLAEQYVTFPPPQKRQIMVSVFSNLRHENVNLCGEYRLPFAILAENRTYPLRKCMKSSIILVSTYES